MQNATAQNLRRFGEQITDAILGIRWGLCSKATLICTRIRECEASSACEAANSSTIANVNRQKLPWLRACVEVSSPHQ
jgi:hypothetical protein